MRAAPRSTPPRGGGNTSSSARGRWIKLSVAVDVDTALPIDQEDNSKQQQRCHRVHHTVMADDRTWRWSLDGLSPREWMQRVLLVLLVVICLSGDFFLYQQILLSSWSFLRHLVDSATHLGVGFCAWGIFLCFSHDKRIPRSSSTCSSTKEPTPLPVLDESAGRGSTTSAPLPELKEWKKFLLSCLIAGATAALLDVDHFIAAGALSISGATHLQGRPFAHSLTFVIFVAIATWLFSKYYKDGTNKWTRVHRLSFVLTTLLSHQIRDGMRLGLWLWPLGSTPGIFYLVYIFMELALPIALARWQVNCGGQEDDEEDESEDERSTTTMTSLPEPQTNRDDDGHVLHTTTTNQRQEYVTPAGPPPPPQLF